MKHKFALLTIVGALLALAVPGISSASIYPAGAKFEIVGTGGQGPKLGSALGTCSLGITGQIPKAPENEAAAPSFAIATPTTSNCTSGTTVSLSGEWKVTAGGTSGFSFIVFSATPEAIVIRSTTLPGCKLTGSNQLLSGIFSNGITSPKALSSAVHGHFSSSYTWANDGKACAIAGTKEDITFGNGANTVHTVKNLTTPAAPIIVAG